MQGFAFVHQRPIVGVPVLEALAQLGSRDLAAGAIVASWMDAHRHEVFSGAYRVATPAPLLRSIGSTRSTARRSICRSRR